MFLINEILRPLSHRVGTLVGTFLTAQGIAQADISILLAALPVFVGVCLDLFVRRVL